jgi:ATP phosphoribosyltransferase
MLKIAVPNKGALSEGAVQILKEAGYHCKRGGRELIVTDKVNEIEFIFLRPRDIAVYVGNGVLDLGITGRDLALDSGAKVSELMPLDFGKSDFYYATPRESGLTPDKFAGLRIATSYPEIVRCDLEKRGIDAKVVRLDGAIEISIKLGVADAIADVVESGRTLREAGLETVGEPVMNSEAVLIAGGDGGVIKRTEVDILLKRLRGILVARSYAMIEYDIPRARLDEACTITPGIESPTVSPLNNPEWAAVKSMITRKGINSAMDSLQAIGARGIIVTDIRTCRI